MCRETKKEQKNSNIYRKHLKASYSEGSKIIRAIGVSNNLIL
jgi:hypothetical protein